MGCLASSVPRQVLPLYVRSRHLIRAAPLNGLVTLQDARDNVTKFGREVLLGRLPYCRWAVGTVMVVVAVLISAAYSHVSRTHQALWKEISSGFDTDTDAHYNLTEVLQMLDIGSDRTCRADALCVPEDGAKQWLSTMGNDAGVDEARVLEMFLQLPQVLLPRRTVDRFARLATFTWYLNIIQAVCALSCSILVVFLLWWLRREVQKHEALRLGMRWKELVSMKGSANKAKREGDAEVAKVRQRLTRATLEMKRMEEETKRKAEECRAAECELRERERLISALMDPMEEQGHPERDLCFLYASPLMYLTASGVPGHVAPLRVDAEYELLRRALSQRAGISTASFRRDLATPRRLMELVMSSSPGLCLHLSCHGSEHYLQLEDDVGCMEVLPKEKLEKWISEKRDVFAFKSPELVVLLCCESAAIGRLLLEAGVRHVVCTKGKLRDEVARKFTAEFWCSIAQPENSVPVAFHRALILLQAQDRQMAKDAQLLMLLPGDDVSDDGERSPALQGKTHSEPLLPKRMKSFGASAANGCSILASAAEREDLVGREFLTCTVLRLLRGPGARRVVCVHGETGIGKTAFVDFLAAFVRSPGRMYSGAVLYEKGWHSREEPLHWLWLEALWVITGQHSWAHEEAGLQPENLEQMRESLVAELRRGQRRFLLIVDNADMVQNLDDLISPLLERTSNISVVLTSRTPWHRDLGGFKVMDVGLKPLDGLSSAKLFLKRVHRQLNNRDFDDDIDRPENEACMQATRATPVPDGWQANVEALMEHPLLAQLGGHPDRIRKAAEQVTDELPTIHALRIPNR